MKENKKPKRSGRATPEMVVINYGLTPARREALFLRIDAAMSDRSNIPTEGSLLFILANLAAVAGELGAAQLAPAPVKRMAALVCTFGLIKMYLDWSTARAYAKMTKAK